MRESPPTTVTATKPVPILPTPSVAPLPILLPTGAPNVTDDGPPIYVKNNSWDHQDLIAAGELLNQKRYSESLAKVEQFLSSHPPDPKAWAIKGLSLRGLNRDAEAITAFEQEVALKPDSPLGSANLAYLRNKVRQR